MTPISLLNAMTETSPPSSTTSSIPTSKSTPNNKPITQNNHPPPKKQQPTTSYNSKQPPITATTHGKPTPIGTPINKPTGNPQFITNQQSVQPRKLKQRNHGPTRHHREAFAGHDEREVWAMREKVWGEGNDAATKPSSRHRKPTTDTSATLIASAIAPSAPPSPKTSGLRESRLEEATVLQGERGFKFLMEYVILTLWVYDVWVCFGVWLEEVSLWSGVWWWCSARQWRSDGRERAAEMKERERK